MKTIAFVMALSMAGAAQSQSICPDIEKSAVTIMAARQNGASMSHMMQIAEETPHAAIRGLLRDMTLAAFKRPRMSVQANRDRAVQDFAEYWAALCYEAK